MYKHIVVYEYNAVKRRATSLRVHTDGWQFRPNTTLSYKNNTELLFKSMRTIWCCASLCPSGVCVSPESPSALSAQGSESSADADVESSAAEADQDLPDDTG